VPRCAASGIAHRGGLVEHGHETMWALRGDGTPVRLSHPDDVLKLTSGDPDAQVAVLIQSVDLAAPSAGDFTGGPREGQSRSLTSFRQSKQRHAFPVSDHDHEQLKRFVAQAGTAGRDQVASMGQLDAETQRWSELAAQVGMRDLVSATKMFSPSEGGPPQVGAGYLRALLEHRFRTSGRLDEARRIVAAPRSQVPTGRLSPELKKLAPKAGELPRHRLKVVAADSRPGEVSHLEVRFVQRVARAVTGSDEYDARLYSPGEVAAGMDGAAADAIVKAQRILAELVSNPVHDARFAADLGQVSDQELAALQVNGAAYNRFAVTVHDPFTDPDDPRTLVVVCATVPAQGSAEDRRNAVFVTPVTCFHVAARDQQGAQPGPVTPVRPDLSLSRGDGWYRGDDRSPGYGPDKQAESTLASALHALQRASRGHGVAPAA
jgi:hypothetical protein